MICNQAARFNRCLFRVQQNMQEQMKTIWLESKGKGSAKVSSALDEHQFFMDFNASITQAAAKTMEHLSDFVFISMGNLTLARRDSYLNHVKGGVKPDTIATLRTPHCTSLPCSRIVSSNGQKRKLHTLRPKDNLAQGVRVGTTHMSIQRKGQIRGRIPTVTDILGRTLGRVATINPRGSLPAIYRNQPRASSHINDNYCVTKLQTRLLAGSSPQTIDICTNLNVKPHVVSSVHTAPGVGRYDDPYICH